MALIPFGHGSGAISMQDLIDFFGGAPNATIPYYPPNNLGSFYKGGAVVPNIAQNAAIPTSGAISLSNFRNAYTDLYFVRTPATKQINKNTITTGGQVVAAWYLFDGMWGNPADWEMGYGANMKYACQYQYTLTITSYNVFAGGVYIYPRLTAATPSPVGYSSGLKTGFVDATSWTEAGNLGFGVEMFVYQNTEAYVTGYITMSVRHPLALSTVITTNVNFTFNVFGP